MFIRSYLRASTEDQNASRAKGELEQFAQGHGFKIAKHYIENASGTKLDRPELLELLEDAQTGDVLLVEQIDRLTRLNKKDWDTLKNAIKAKGLKVVSVFDLPTSHSLLKDSSGDEFSNRMQQAMTDMLMDMLAAIARKEYDDRRRRQAQGIAKAKTEQKYTGRKVDTKLHAVIAKHLQAGVSYSEIEALTKASRATIAKVSKQLKEAVSE